MKPLHDRVSDLEKKIIELEAKLGVVEKFTPTNLATSIDFQEFQSKVFEKLDIKEAEIIN